MHVNCLDTIYESDLSERERKRHPFAQDLPLQALLSTQTLKKTDFRGPRMKLSKTVTAVDVIRQATNMMNDKVCRVARELEVHIDFSADCSDIEPPKSPSNNSRRSLSSSQTSLASAVGPSVETFDSIVQGYLNLIAGTLTVIIERGNNNVLSEAVEAVLAHLNFVDTIKLSLVRPLLTTYPMSSQVELHATQDGIAAAFHCLLGHSLPKVLLFSNISTILALENVITAPCLAPIFYCYWSCLHSNLKEFAKDIASAEGLAKIRRQQYAALFRIAEREIEVQEARLYMARYNTSGSWPDLAIPSDTDSEYSYTSSATDESILEPVMDDNYSVASNPRPCKSPPAKEVSFSLFRSKTPVLMSKLATVYEKEKLAPKRWSFLLKSAA